MQEYVVIIGIFITALIDSSQQIAAASTDYPITQREFGSHCPESYHSLIDDETGQCYSNEEGCDGYVIKDGIHYSFVFIEDEDGDRCADPAYLCNDDSSHETCREYLVSN